MDDLSAIIENIKKSIVVVTLADGKRGSGFFVNDKGLFVTNKHVVELKTFIKIILNSGKEYEATIVYSDNDLDIAFGVANCVVEKVAPIGDSNLLREGEHVIAIGHPFGYDFTITRGIVSCKNRIVKGVGYIQSDVAINPGSSGGPLINYKGEVVGMTTWAVEGADNMGFAVPTAAFKAMLDTMNTNFSKLQLMYYCPICGFLSNTFVKTPKGDYCRNCGTAKREKKREEELGAPGQQAQAVNVASIKCPKCTAVNDSVSNFCKKCGYKLQ